MTPRLFVANAVQFTRLVEPSTTMFHPAPPTTLNPNWFVTKPKLASLTKILGIGFSVLTTNQLESPPASGTTPHARIVELAGACRLSSSQPAAIRTPSPTSRQSWPLVETWKNVRLTSGLPPARNHFSVNPL